jgi:hypothetical protein
MMKKWWWVAMLACSFLSADMTKESASQDIQKIDKEIQKLEVQKKKHIDLSRKYQAEGDNWEYKTGRIQDAHEAWGKADDERARAIEYQGKIDLLLEKKQRIYQIYPELQYQ